MTEWLYKATPTKISFEATRDLALDDGFLCRSAFEENGTRADNTQHVDFGDVIHIYFTGDGEPQTIGSFLVVGPNKHPHGSRFGASPQGTVLVEVRDQAFADKLANLGTDGEGYEPDPKLDKFIGWALVPRDDVSPPPYSPELFPGQSTLIRRP